MGYEKPKARPSMVCHYARWSPDGLLREARYRPEQKPLPPEPSDAMARPSRGALAAERQGQLI